MKTKFKFFVTLLVALLVQIIFAQEKSVSGVVSDDMGPISDISITVKGSDNGAITDFDGKYTIKAKTGDVLMFSHVSYVSVLKTVNSSTINVNMKSSANDLDAVVITGLGIKREKKSLGYSQQSLGGEELKKGRDADINNALAGKVAGVQIVGKSSTTFGNSKIKLRGESGVLYVVDGIIVESIGDINADNVADMSVLKGASATAIYGPEGRDGVVIITTNHAKSGKAVFSVNHSTSINKVSILPEYQNEYGGGYSQTFNTFSYDAATDPASWASFDGQSYPDFWADESWGPRMEGQMVRHWDSWIPGTPEFGELRAWSPQEDNIKDFYDTGITSNTSLKFSKAGEGYSVATSFSMIDQGGIVPNSNQKTINYSVNASFDVNKKFRVFTNANYQDRVRLNMPDQNYGNLGSNMNQWWQRQLDTDRLRRYERNGQIVSWNMRGPRDARPLYWDMPAFHSYENFRHDYKNSFFGKIGGEYKFNDKFKALFEIRGFSKAYSGDDRATTKSLLDQSSYREMQRTKNKEQYFGMATYADKFMDDAIDVNINVGAEVVNYSDEWFFASTNGGLSIPEFYNLAGSTDPASVGTFKERYRTQGMFTRASVGYKGLVYLDGSYRMDWSSTADPKANRQDTWGVSTSFLLHKVLPKNDILTFVKLRAGLAKAPYFPDPYDSGSTYRPGALYQGNGTLEVSNSQANPILKGGLREEMEIGTEIKFLNNKISLDLTYFDRNDSDLPTRVDLDGATGYTSIVVNSGKTTSKGIELGLNATVVKTKDLTWDIGINYGTLDKQVVSIYEDIQSYNISTYTSSMKLQARVGEEYGLFYGRGFANHTDGSTIFTASDTFARESNKKIGGLLPDYTGGFTSNLNYKGFNLFLGFDGQKGGLYYSRTERYFLHSGLGADTAGLNDKGNPKRDPVADGGGVHIVGVLQTGTNADGVPISDGTVVDKYIDAASYFNLGNLGNIYENNVHDASYLKLRTVRLDYTFGSKIAKKIGMDEIELGIFGNNVWLINSDLEWVDPSELEERNEVNWAENGTLPMTTSFGMNLKLKF